MGRKNAFDVALDGPLDGAIKGAPKDTSEDALKDALSDLHIDIKKVHLWLHVRVLLRLQLKGEFDGTLQRALVSATEETLGDRSEGAMKSVLWDLYKDIPQSFAFISRENISKHLPMTTSEI